MDNTVKAWDLLQRVLHWSLVASIAICWWAGEERLSLHIACGYMALAVAGLRGTWGFVGGRYARFTEFVRGPVAVLRYAKAIVDGREQRFIGHNPLGGWMIVALLLCILGVCVTGILYTTDYFWGMAWVEVSHRTLAWTLVALIALHLGGVAFTSWRHRENLVGAMFSGRKRAPSADDTA